MNAAVRQHPKTAVIGLGYVGWPLVLALAEQREVAGYDIDSSRVAELTEESRKQPAAIAQGVCLTTDIADTADCQCYIITVPTPVNSDNQPDISLLLAACRELGKVVQRGDLVVLESTVYPGVTANICAPVIGDISGLTPGIDFDYGYSPERISPDENDRNDLKKITKLVGGCSEQATARIYALYDSIITAGVVTTPTIEVAELSKLLENIQRDVNIALINEVAKICQRLNINTHDVIAAAATKWNFQPLKPGLVGGHCIGVDPYYLIRCAAGLNTPTPLMTAARSVNEGMAEYVATRTVELMKKARLGPRDARVLILGFSFKENCADVRNTKIIDLFELLEEQHCSITLCDPLADVDKALELYRVSIEQDLETVLSNHWDVIIFAVRHRVFQQIEAPMLKKSLVIDLKNCAPRADWRL